jgi:hypothetical protein
MRPLPRHTPIVDDSGMITRPWAAILETDTASSNAQPGAGDWTLALIEYGYGDPSGKHTGANLPVAHLRAVVTARPANATYFSVFDFWGASTPSDPAAYGSAQMSQPIAATGSTTIDWWIPRPAVDTTLQVALTACTATFAATPANVTASVHSVVVTAVHAPAQPASLTATLWRQTRGGVDSGALQFAWPAPSDLEYFAGKVYRAQTDSSYTPAHSTLSSSIDAVTLTIPITSSTHFVVNESGVLIGTEQILVASIGSGVINASQRGAKGTTAAAHASGASVDVMWDYMGVGMGAPGDASDGFDQRSLNGGTWWSLGPEAYFQFKVDSVSRAEDTPGHNLENTVSPPTANLHVPAANSVTIAPPGQPGSGDWSISVASYGHDPQTGQNVALVTAVVTTNPADTTLFSLLAYQGASPPADPAQYGDIVGVFKRCDQTKASSGSTTLNAWVIRQSSNITLQFVLLASTASHYAQGPDAGAPKALTINAVGTPAQVTGLTVTALSLRDGGLHTGKLQFSFTIPADPEFYEVNIYRCQTNSSYVPTTAWSLLFSIQVPVGTPAGAYTWTQDNSWPWIDAASWWSFHAFTESRAYVENTTVAGGNTANLAMTASSGIQVAASSLGATINLDPVNGLLVTNGSNSVNLNSGYVWTHYGSASGFLSPAGMTLSDATGGPNLTTLNPTSLTFKVGSTAYITLSQNSGFSYIDSPNYKANGTQFMNSSAQFIGAGINCPAYPVNASGFNPFNGYQLYGQNYNAFNSPGYGLGFVVVIPAGTLGGGLPTSDKTYGVIFGLGGANPAYSRMRFDGGVLTALS